MAYVGKVVYGAHSHSSPHSTPTLYQNVKLHPMTTPCQIWEEIFIGLVCNYYALVSVTKLSLECCCRHFSHCRCRRRRRFVAALVLGEHAGSSFHPVHDLLLSCVKCRIPVVEECGPCGSQQAGSVCGGSLLLYAGLLLERPKK